MQKDDQVLKDIFSSAFAEDVSYESHTEDFLFIESKLKANAFYKFSFTKFNLYYALGILCSVLFTGSVAGHYFLTQKENDVKMQHILQAVEEKSVNEAASNSIANEVVVKENLVPGSLEKPDHTVRVVLETTKTDKKSDKIKVNSDKNKSEAKVSNVSHLDIQPEMISSDKDSVVTTPVQIKEEKRIRVKTVKIIKQDTIIRYDSVKLKPRIPFFRK